MTDARGRIPSDRGAQASLELQDFLDEVTADLEGQSRSEDLGTFSADSARRTRITELIGTDGSGGKLAELKELTARTATAAQKAQVVTDENLALRAQTAGVTQHSVSPPVPPTGDFSEYEEL